MKTKYILKNYKRKKYFKVKKIRNYNEIIDESKICVYKLLIIIIFSLITIFLIINRGKKNKENRENKENKTNNIFEEDDVTLVTGLFQVDNNRHKFDDYFIWVNKLLQINKPIIFYTQSNLSSILKEKRPKKYENKTIWIEKNFTDFYSYKKYLQAFKETYIIDGFKFKHTVDLYIIWSEKIIFLKESIENNFFKSKYFFWVDAGLFRDDKNMDKFLENWPCTEKLEKDPRVMLNGIKEIKKDVFDKLMKFDPITHDKYKNDYNVAGGFFGGRFDYLKKFFNYYYEILELFHKNKVYIGTDQNLFAIAGYSHPEAINIINSGDYNFLKNYLVPQNL